MVRLQNVFVIGTEILKHIRRATRVAREKHTHGLALIIEQRRAAEARSAAEYFEPRVAQRFFQRGEVTVSIHQTGPPKFLVHQLGQPDGAVPCGRLTMPGITETRSNARPSSTWSSGGAVRVCVGHRA